MPIQVHEIVTGLHKRDELKQECTKGIDLSSYTWEGDGPIQACTGEKRIYTDTCSRNIGPRRYIREE